MSEGTQKFIDALADGDNAAAGEAFKDALRSKVGDALDAKRKDLASNMFNKAVTEAEPYSDPKPEIADTGTFTQDGQVVATGNAKDGQAEIDLTQNNEAE